MALQTSADVRYIVSDTLFNMGFAPNYIRRSLSLYEKHYDCSTIGYDIATITEIIYRLTIKDKLKQSRAQQKIYHSKVNLKQALQCIGFTPNYIDMALQQYETVYDSHQSYDIRIITQTIMQLRAEAHAHTHRPQKQHSKLRIKLDKPHEMRPKTKSLSTNDSGDTPLDSNAIAITHAMDTLPEEPKRNDDKEYSGYLWKQSSRQSNKWQKRWFIIRNGTFQYFADSTKASNYSKSNEDSQGRKGYIGGIATCDVKKESIDKLSKYVFSVTTPMQRTYLLKASNRKEYDEWLALLSSEERSQYTLKESETLHCNVMEHSCKVISDDKLEYQKKQNLFIQIQKANPYCADCDQESPEWVSINIGVVLCTECCAIHRGLGVAISKIRSLVLDDLDVNTLKCVVNIGGNHRLNNELLEFTLPQLRKLNYEQCTAQERAEFIVCKYVNRMYINTNDVNIFNVNALLYDAAVRNDCLGMLIALYNKADIDYVFPNRNNMTVLQAVILKDNEEAIQLLMNNDATPVLQI